MMSRKLGRQPPDHETAKILPASATKLRVVTPDAAASSCTVNPPFASFASIASRRKMRRLACRRAWSAATVATSSPTAARADGENTRTAARAMAAPSQERKRGVGFMARVEYSSHRAYECGCRRDSLDRGMAKRCGNVTCFRAELG